MGVKRKKIAYLHSFLCVGQLIFFEKAESRHSEGFILDDFKIQLLLSFLLFKCIFDKFLY